MPALGMAQDTGKLINWLKKEGQQVAKGEPLMEVETDKATVEIEAPASGILAGVTASDGDIIPVAQVIALILSPGEAAPARAAPTPTTTGIAPSRRDRLPSITASPVAVHIAEEHKVDLSQVKPASGEKITKADVLAFVETQKGSVPSDNDGKLVPASPKARRLASERGMDLAALRGSGLARAILAADVMNAAGQPAFPHAASEGTEVSRAWRAMAGRLSSAWQTVPHFYLMREVDATRLVAWREAAQNKFREGVTYTDLLVKAAAIALSQHSRVNSSWNEQGITHNPAINVGLAVAVEDGLIVPVIHQADRLSVREIATVRRELIERASAGKLRLDDLQGGSFTISNLGMYGVDAFNAIINPPEAAILAVGRITDRVIAVDGQPAVRPMIMLTLSCDHRVIDGARGAQFLDTLASFIDEPIRLID